MTRSADPIVTTLLHAAGLRTHEELWALAAPGKPGPDTGEAAALRQLAGRMGLALEEVETNERGAARELSSIVQGTATEQRNVGQGFRRDPTWIAQSVREYAKRCAQLQQAIAEAQAYGDLLRTLTGRQPIKAEGCGDCATCEAAAGDPGSLTEAQAARCTCDPRTCAAA